jgi:hypothetical protein
MIAPPAIYDGAMDNQSSISGVVSTAQSMVCDPSSQADCVPQPAPNRRGGAGQARHMKRHPTRIRFPSFAPMIPAPGDRPRQRQGGYG